METLQSTRNNHSHHLSTTLSSPPILQQQSLNIHIQNTSSCIANQQENLIDHIHTPKFVDQNAMIIVNQSENIKKYRHMKKNSIISNVMAQIDDFEKDDLLLSTSTIRTEDLIKQHQTICKLHGKVEDIICMVQKIKICCYCALFGLHKDHTFKSEAQIIQEISNLESKIRQTDKKYKIIFSEFSSESNLKLIQEYCETKKQDSICELDEQVNIIIQKIRRTKEEIKVKTISHFDRIIKQIEQSWQNTTININKSVQYDQWKENAISILNIFSQKLETCDFIEPFKEYQKFQWEKGGIIVDKYKQILRNFTKRSQQSLDDLKFNHSYSLKNILADTLQFDSQKAIELNVQTPVTSLQKLHRQLSCSLKPEHFQNSIKNQFLQNNIRHSQLIQSSLEPIQEQIGKIIRQKRCSFNSGIKKMRSDSSFGNNNFSTLLTRQKSNPRLSQTIKSPKSRASIYKSPSHNRFNKNPLEILSNFQRNRNQTSLNFSYCGLKCEQILYFVQKAFNSHIPIDINLERNKLSLSGLAKLLPFLSKVVSVNLSKTQLDESCLQVLSKIKVVRRLYEVNLSENNISTHKNQGKLQQLRKMGLKIIT